MKYRITALIITLSLICLSGCVIKLPELTTDTPAPATEDPVAAASATKVPTVKIPIATATPDPVIISEDFFAEDDFYAIQTLSRAAASAVWQYGKDLGWVDEYGLTESIITPRQLALSQAAYRQTLIYWCWENPINNDLADDKRESCYAQALFPDVLENALPEEDEFSGWSWGVNVFSQVESSWPLIPVASADGKVGHVLVRFFYENDNGFFEDFYLVVWEKSESINAEKPFRYQLAGVRPMMRFLLGYEPHDYFSEKYLESIPTETLKKLGITHPLGYLDKWGAWGTWEPENIIIMKTISSPGEAEHATYILLHEDEENITYLSASDDIVDYRAAPWQALTVLQARNLLYENYVDAELFYPGELDKLKDGALCYCFGYYDGEDNYRYAFVNSVTKEVEFADEIEDYTRTGEDY